ncbi:PAS/PAC sensor signal transduction histidine kinase [Altererythrobacter xiamenensis]|uniref:histidine kinase n=1 Tax=Altererythrobacter xiamenensis TaxID=1316679 RepID=A0A1Y6FL79_9SPHN|nr:PAS domain-containing sensor histidine kinase [Altererythrobacter xiamenensis]SMQ74261.1 PAS/PAC sensor signal transduction histidine kinase [Altererythrobacter xiamenensis]
MELSPTAIALIGLILAAWTLGAAAIILRSSRKLRRLDALRTSVRRMSKLLDEAPAVPLLVRADGRVEAPEKLAGWLGLDKKPQYLSELAGGQGKGLSPEQLEQLSDAIKATQKSAAPFRMAITPPGSKRSLALRGSLADPAVSPGGSAQVWIFDFSESEAELSELREEATRAKGDFAALVGLIEAAPMPMWFRGPDARLRLVNRAYVEAVDAEDAEQVVSKQIELIEEIDGLGPAQIAQQAAQQGLAAERIVPATTHGQRRSYRVSDLPLGSEGVAGYAIDIEEMEQQAREFRAFREAQRAMLDQLSLGVAQFDASQKLVFANKPFLRQFDLSFGAITDALPFDRFLSDAREKRRTPEVRDFPAWRAEHLAWFGTRDTQEEAWPLPGGVHLRIVAQPMPDGGLVLIAEDRTEQLALSATRDTLLRTRTATLDSLFEALAVFAPDGSLQLWNRSFAGTWGLDEDELDSHPSADQLLKLIAPNLARPARAKVIGEIIRAATLDRQEKGGRIELADGRTLEFAGVPLPDGNGLLTVLDITDSQKAENALRERNIALEEADAVKARFLANMSYEFRTPLTSIGGFAELIQSGAAGEVSDQLKEYTDAILESVGRLTEQVENVLDLSQSEAGLLPLNLERVELLPFVTEVVRSREKAILDGGLSLDLRGNAGGSIEADKRQLGRAIGNLLDNAIGATGEGGKILVDIARGKSGARIVISDNGSGMENEELSRALDGMRAKEDGSLERRQGLGIPLARQLVEAHGGTLTLQSEKGAGTTAMIRLP